MCCAPLACHRRLLSLSGLLVLPSQPAEIRDALVGCLLPGICVDSTWAHNRKNRIVLMTYALRGEWHLVFAGGSSFPSDSILVRRDGTSLAVIPANVYEFIRSIIRVI